MRYSLTDIISVNGFDWLLKMQDWRLAESKFSENNTQYQLLKIVTVLDISTLLTCQLSGYFEFLNSSTFPATMRCCHRCPVRRIQLLPRSIWVNAGHKRASSRALTQSESMLVTSVQASRRQHNLSQCWSQACKYQSINTIWVNAGHKRASIKASRGCFEILNVEWWYTTKNNKTRKISEWNKINCG